MARSARARAARRSARLGSSSTAPSSYPHRSERPSRFPDILFLLPPDVRTSSEHAHATHARPYLAEPGRVLVRRCSLPNPSLSTLLTCELAFAMQTAVLVQKPKKLRAGFRESVHNWRATENPRRRESPSSLEDDRQIVRTRTQ